MSQPPSERERSEGFSIEPRNRFFEANRSIVDHEIRAGRSLTILGEVDLNEVERIRLSAPTLRKPTYTTFVVKAVALALREHPGANRRVCRTSGWPPGAARLQAFTARDVAVMVERDLPGAEESMFLDIIRDADSATLDAITHRLETLTKADPDANPHWREHRERVGKYPSWLANILGRLPSISAKRWVQNRGGAVLVSSSARYGVDAMFGAWHYPISVSFGQAKNRPAVVGKDVVPRRTFFLTLDFDRRVMGTAQGARFFRRIVENLENAATVMQSFIPEEAPVTREDFPTMDVPITRI